MAVGAPTLHIDEQGAYVDGVYTTAAFTPTGGSNSVIYICQIVENIAFTGGGVASMSTDGTATDISENMSAFSSRGLTLHRIKEPTASSQTANVERGDAIGTNELRVIVIELAGVDQTTPEDTPLIPDGDDASDISTDVNSPTGDRVLAFLVTSESAVIENTEIGSQVQLAATGVWGAAQHVAGAGASTSCDFTSISGQSAAILINVNASGGGGSVLPIIYQTMVA